MLTNENMVEAPTINKFNAFVRKSVDRASTAASTLKSVSVSVGMLCPSSNFDSSYYLRACCVSMGSLC